MNKTKLLSCLSAVVIGITLSGCSLINDTPDAASASDTFISASETLTEAPETTVSETADTTVPADTTASAASGKEAKSAGLKYVPGKGTLCDEPDKMIQRKANNVSQIVGTMYNGQPVKSNFYYYRCMLNNNGKSAYDTIHAGLLTGADTIKLSTPLSTANVDIVYYSVLYDDPQIVWAEPGYDYTYNNSGNVVSISPIYNRLAKDISGAKKSLEKSVSKALSVMWDLPNNIERSKYAHDYLTHTIDYSEGELDQNAYSALVQHKTVCAGYSQAYAYMMQKMGAPCAVLIGYAGEDHAWNIVTLNGENYVTDVTWDDPLDNPPDTYYYDYFNITSAQMSRDHTLQSPSTYLAAATGTKASYYNYFGGNAYGTNFDNPTTVSNTPTVTTSNHTTNPPAITTKPPVTTTKTSDPYDWNSYWNDDWWSNYDIDTNWYTTSSSTKPPVTTTKPPVTTTKTSDPYNWDNYWNDDWWSNYDIDTNWYTTSSSTKPPVTTTKPPVTTTKPSDPYNWDNYWNDDWWNNYGIDTGGNNNWNWDYSNDYCNWGNDHSGNFDYNSDYNYDYNNYFDDYWYDRSISSDWWSYLDPYWKKSDWKNEGNGLWSIEDPDTGYLYMYDENTGTFYCMDDDIVYRYDKGKDDWVKN